MKEWKIRVVSEKDLGMYARRLQSVLNRMERESFDFTVEGPGASAVEINGEIRFMALITGSRDKHQTTDISASAIDTQTKKIRLVHDKGIEIVKENT
jgi:hypothetical protein